MKDAEILEAEKQKAMHFKKLVLGPAVDFDGAALLQFDDESTDEDGVCDAGVVQVKRHKWKPKVVEEPVAVPKDMVAVIREGITAHKEMMLASKEAADARSQVLVGVLEKFLVSEWDSQMVMQVMLQDMAFKVQERFSAIKTSKKRV